jgi:hypothetical protein
MVVGCSRHKRSIQNLGEIEAKCSIPTRFAEFSSLIEHYAFVRSDSD